MRTAPVFRCIHRSVGGGSAGGAALPSAGPAGTSAALGGASRHLKPKERTTMLTVGDKLPQFNLKALVGGTIEKGKEFRDITDQSHPGKWQVLFFWPMDFTFI